MYTGLSVSKLRQPREDDTNHYYFWCWLDVEGGDWDKCGPVRCNPESDENYHKFRGADFYTRECLSEDGQGPNNTW